MTPESGPRFPGPGLRDSGDPVPDAGPWLAYKLQFELS